MPSTTASWARQLHSFAEIPYVFKEFIPQSEPLSYIIYSPADNWGKRQINAKLTCMYLDKIVILEAMENKVDTVYYWFKDIDYIEQGTMLLYSWIGIHGFVNGTLSSSIIEYNSVVTPYFRPIIKLIRQMYPVLEANGDNQNLSKLKFLEILNYKFYNYSQESILPEEKIIGTVYQSAVYEKFMILFTRIIIFAHLTILTDKELIIIKEEELVEVKKKSNVKNGGVWAYIPLHKIIDITMHNNEKRKGLLTLMISIERDKIYLTFSHLKRLELEALITEFKTIYK